MTCFGSLDRPVDERDEPREDEPRLQEGLGAVAERREPPLVNVYVRGHIPGHGQEPVGEPGCDSGARAQDKDDGGGLETLRREGYM